jgi:hypothetical protein
MHDDTGGAVLSSGDWLRRGLLSIRLQHEEDAERALRVCVNGGFNLTAWLGLMYLYSRSV